MKHKGKSKGFTLVELLVVIAIIGILAAVVLVSLSSSGKKAKMSKALMTMKSLLPGAMDCYMRGELDDITLVGKKPDDDLCAGSAFKFPPFPANGTNYGTGGFGYHYSGPATAAGAELTFQLYDGDGPMLVYCCYAGTDTGKCEVVKTSAEKTVNCK